MPLDIVEGWTGNLDFTLKVDGTAQDLGGMTITLVLTDKDGNLVNTTGDITVTGASTGQVRYAPDDNDLLANKSPYRARFKAVDATPQTTFFPNGPGDEWRVHKP